MSYQILLVLSVQIAIMHSAPLLLMAVPLITQSAQEIVLQKQLMELQALQQLTQSGAQLNNQPQQLMILLPKQESAVNVNTNEGLKVHKQSDRDSIYTNLDNEKDDLNSVVIDAASDTADNQNQAVPQPRRAILLIPNARLSIGGIVSAIPWLPIEINVPDTISWAYNGIASGIGSIISIIGRPFQGTPDTVQENGMKSVLKQVQMKQNMFPPIVMMPIDGPVLPIQV